MIIMINCLKENIFEAGGYIGGKRKDGAAYEGIMDL